MAHPYLFWGGARMKLPSRVCFIGRGREWKQKATRALVISCKPYSSLSIRGGFLLGMSQVINHKEERAGLRSGQWDPMPKARL